MRKLMGFYPGIWLHKVFTLSVFCNQLLIFQTIPCSLLLAIELRGFLQI
jgi:hypothetical protein